MRASRLIAVAWRDIRLLASGQRWYRLPLLALGLLLPTGAVPLRTPELPEPPAVAAGDIPPALADRIEARPRAALRMRGQDPVVVRAKAIPKATRAALDTLPGEPVVIVDKLPTPTPIPARSLLLALLSLSLLTGPLAESLPGERSRGTLATLRTASISGVELVAGKWLAWAGVASAFTLGVAGIGAFTGAQAAGLWMTGLPMVAAMAVSLGLWLGRDADDEIDGAARTMRVIPAVALGLATVAFLLSLDHPALAGAIPLGGAILLAGDMLPGPLPALTAGLSTLLATGALLAHTTSALETERAKAPLAWRPWAGLVFAAAVPWWLVSMGPTTWSMAGNPDLAADLDLGAGLAAAGAMLAAMAWIQALRAHVPLERPSWGGLPRGVAVGVGLAMAAGLSAWVPALGGEAWEAARLRMLAAQAPGWAGVMPAVLVALGHEALFRGWMQRRYGAVWAGVAWVLVCSPLEPVRGVLVAATLGMLSHRRGWVAALVAHLSWSFLGSTLSMPSLSASLMAAGLVGVVAWLPGGAARYRSSM